MQSTQIQQFSSTIQEIDLNLDNTFSAERLQMAENAFEHYDFEEATRLYGEAQKETPNNHFIVQRLACSIYKSQLPDEMESLEFAETMLQEINDDSNAETLGLLGAIHKRFHFLTDTHTHLDKSLSFYEKGYYDQLDYYNAINTAFLYLLKANRQADKLGSVAYYDHCIETWAEVIVMCQKIIYSPDFDRRNDKHWVYQSLAQAHYGLGQQDHYDEASKMVINLSKGFTDLQTFYDQNQQIRVELGAFKAKYQS
jgi:tetratricopeptide (TPR) repeat protein